MTVFRHLPFQIPSKEDQYVSNISYSNRNCNILRPTFCKKCGKASIFHFHSKYRRKKFLSMSEWLSDFFIFRFRCKLCRHVVPAYQNGYIPSRQANPETEGSALSEARAFLLDFFSQRTLTRWRTRLKALAVLFQGEIFRAFFFAFPSASPNSKSSSVFDSLLGQFNQHLLSKGLGFLVFQLSHLAYLARGDISHHKKCLSTSGTL